MNDSINKLNQIERKALREELVEKKEVEQFLIREDFIIINEKTFKSVSDMDDYLINLK